VDDRCEIYGSTGNTRADLLRGNALSTFSQTGYGYAVEKAGETRGWTFTMYEEVWNYGFPQEMAHFARCVQARKHPIETGEDGREVLKICSPLTIQPAKAAKSPGPTNHPKSTSRLTCGSAPFREP
jgi:predicted dehydrogenase